MGALLLIPFFLIRFGLLSRLDKSAIGRAAHFPPMAGNERIAYWLYQLSNVAIFVSLFFLPVKFAPVMPVLTGAIIYLLGNILLIISMVNFAAPSKGGVNQHGVYALSRNPMYVAYFVYFLGCVLLTQSLILLGLVVLFQIAAHWIILGEERWCTETFGEEYRQYTKRVRRYL